MKFKKIEQINIRNEVKKYFSHFIDFANYNLYFGVINNYFTVLLYTNFINDFIDLDELINSPQIKIIYNEKYYKQNYLNNIVSIIEKSSYKSLEIKSDNIYLKYPISLDFIEWLKVDVELFTESEHIYNTITLPYINSIIIKNTKWINNLLFNKSEESIVLFRNSSFVICKDIIWKDSNPNNFYVLIIPTKHIKTIRDLTQQDIPLLNSIQNKAIEIAAIFNISLDKLAMFFHYHPSYYQLHLHVCINDNPDLIVLSNRHYFLSKIIKKLNKQSDYWHKKTLKFELLSGTKLYRLLKI
jgi:hypothetical protein